MKNKVLITITIIASLGMIFSFGTIETMPTTSLVVGVVSGTWILLFQEANKERFRYYE